MDNNEIPTAHSLVALASVIVASLLTVFLSPSSLGSEKIFSLIIYAVALLLFVKISVLLTTFTLAEFIKIKKETNSENCLGPGDYTLTASVITAGFLTMEIYKYFLVQFSNTLNDWPPQLLAIIIISIPIFYLIFTINKMFNK